MVSAAVIQWEGIWWRRTRKQILVPAREGRWLDGISVVREKYLAAVGAATTANRSILDFAQSYARAHAEADELPGTKQQVRDRKMKLHKDIGIDDKGESWRSNIRAIGGATWMRKYAKHLPVATESLTLIAKATEPAVARLINRGTLDETSSITETRSALNKPKRGSGSVAQRGWSNFSTEIQL